MRILRTIAVTFAQYSRIPMPRFDWKEEDMTYSMSVFPWVGAVIGLIYTAVYLLCCRFGVPETAAALLMTAVPVLITGGFHIDGFMDVSDALSSYGSREEKLRILKDPHIGAFAVIRLVLAGLIFTSSVMTIVSLGAGPLYGSAAGQMNLPVFNTALGFAVSRGFSAVSVLNFRSAKKEGMLYCESTSAGAGRKGNLVFVAVWITIASGLMLYIDLISGAAEIAAALCTFAWYRHLSYREFGGITGDTAGWFVTVCETAVMAAAALSAVIMQQL